MSSTWVVVVVVGVVQEIPGGVGLADRLGYLESGEVGVLWEGCSCAHVQKEGK